MPYRNVDELPESVRGTLPKHAQEIYAAAFNNAFDEYRGKQKGADESDIEATAHRVAWAAVKKSYRKDEDTGEWVKNK